MKRRGRYARGRRTSFKARVKRVILRTAETKKYHFAEENVQLYHNIGYSSTAAPVMTFSSMPIFYNIWAEIPKGAASYQRIGDKITPRGMSLKIWLANKSDRPNLHYRIIIAKVPKQLAGVVTTASSITNPWEADETGSVGNKLIMGLDKDRGIKALYDRVVRAEWGANVSEAAGTVSRKECHTFKKIWLRNKKNRDIVYDSTNAQQIVNNPILLWVIPYDSYGTLTTDNVASCAYRGTLYYKDV